MHDATSERVCVQPHLKPDRVQDHLEVRRFAWPEMLAVPPVEAMPAYTTVLSR